MCDELSISYSYLLNIMISLAWFWNYSFHVIWLYPLGIVLNFNFPFSHLFFLWWTFNQLFIPSKYNDFFGMILIINGLFLAGSNWQLCVTCNFWSVMAASWQLPGSYHGAAWSCHNLPGVAMELPGAAMELLGATINLPGSGCHDGFTWQLPSNGALVIAFRLDSGDKSKS
jgi:hypothetical protein